MRGRIGKDVSIIRGMSDPPCVAELNEMFRDWRTVTNPDAHVPVDGGKIVKAINEWRRTPGYRGYLGLKDIALNPPEEIPLSLEGVIPGTEVPLDTEPVEDVSDEEMIAMLDALVASKCHPSKIHTPPIIAKRTSGA